MNRPLGIDPALATLLSHAPSEELEYGFVMECLKNYKNPRVKLNHLLNIKALIRVKKGIYIFGEHFARRPYSSEVLANMSGETVSKSDKKCIKNQTFIIVG
jgi:hypothetical protein